MCVGFEVARPVERNGEAISPGDVRCRSSRRLGLIEPLGTWILQQACSTFAEWQRKFPDAGLECNHGERRVRPQLRSSTLRASSSRPVEKARLKPARPRIEVTETALMDSPGVARKSARAAWTSA